jgi:hypothetical protein
MKKIFIYVFSMMFLFVALTGAAPLEGLIGNDAGQHTRTVRLDASSHAIKTIDYAHSEAHSGNAYEVTYSALKVTAQTVAVRFQTPDTPKLAHMVITIDAALAAKAEFWANTTMTHNAGGAITPLNVRFDSANTSGMTVCHTPGGSQAGAAGIGPLYLGSASGNGRVVVGGSGGNRAEYILKRNSAYYILVTSTVDDNALTIMLNFYMHTDKD